MKWARRIDAAARRGYFTKQDEEDARDWCRCAVAEILGPAHEATQKDGFWRHRGIDFYDAVCATDFTRAKQILKYMVKGASR